VPNLIPQDIREWMRRMEFKTNDLGRRPSSLVPGDIDDAVDLDGFMSSGRWRRQSTTGTTTALHYPFAGAAGTLEVYWDPAFTQVHQVFYDRAGSIWTRWFNGAVWSAWLRNFYDSGWNSLTGDLTASFTSTTFEVSRVDETVFIQGQVTPTTNWGAVMASSNIMTNLLDAQFCPTQSHIVISGSSATGAMVNFRVSIQSGGQIAVRCDTLNHTGGVFIDHTYRGAPL
jgi:hypothetical protein